MVFVTSDKYPQLKNTVLIGSLVLQKLVVMQRTQLKINKQVDLFKGFGRIRSLHQGRDGFIYVGVDGEGIYRIIVNG